MNSAITQEAAQVEPPRDVLALYDRLARVYDVSAALAESKARRCAFERADVTGHDDILEVAVGTGQMFAALAHANSKGTTCGIDVSPGMPTKARRRTCALDGARRTAARQRARVALPRPLLRSRHCRLPVRSPPRDRLRPGHRRDPQGLTRLGSRRRRHDFRRTPPRRRPPVGIPASPAAARRLSRRAARSVSRVGRLRGRTPRGWRIFVRAG